MIIREQLRALDTFTKKKKTTSKVDIGSGVGFGGNDNFAIDSLTLNANGDSGPNIKGIFLTHGHYGHYAGLLNFGKVLFFFFSFFELFSLRLFCCCLLSR